MWPLKPMPSKKESQPTIESTRPPFVTIDDVIKEAEKLASILRELGGQKHPLDIRRGMFRPQEGRAELATHGGSSILKAGSKTYVFDIKQARNGASYLAIRERRGEQDVGQAKGAIYIFAEHARAFSQAIRQMTTRLG